MNILTQERIYMNQQLTARRIANTGEAYTEMADREEFYRDFQRRHSAELRETEMLCNQALREKDSEVKSAKQLALFFGLTDLILIAALVIKGFS